MKSEEIRERLTQLETSCLCDAKKTLRCLDPAIRPLSLGLQLVGRAFTVACCNDFLTVIKALQDAAPGDVLVVDGQQGRTALAGESATSGKAGGLKKVEPLKAVDAVNRSKRFGCEPPTGGHSYHRSI